MMVIGSCGNKRAAFDRHATVEFCVPRPIVLALLVPPVMMKPDVKSGEAPALRRMFTSPTVSAPPLTLNVPLKSELVRKLPIVAVPLSITTWLGGGADQSAGCERTSCIIKRAIKCSVQHCCRG